MVHMSDEESTAITTRCQMSCFSCNSRSFPLNPDLIGITLAIPRSLIVQLVNVIVACGNVRTIGSQTDKRRTNEFPTVLLDVVDVTRVA